MLGWGEGRPSVLSPPPAHTGNTLCAPAREPRPREPPVGLPRQPHEACSPLPAPPRLALSVCEHVETTVQRILGREGGQACSSRSPVGGVGWCRRDSRVPAPRAGAAASVPTHTVCELREATLLRTQTLTLIWEADPEKLTPTCRPLQGSLKRCFNSSRCTEPPAPGPLSSLFSWGWVSRKGNLCGASEKGREDAGRSQLWTLFLKGTKARCRKHLCHS